MKPPKNCDCGIGYSCSNCRPEPSPRPAEAPLSAEPRILSAEQVAKLWEKGERDRAALMWSDLHSLISSHEALRLAGKVVAEAERRHFDLATRNHNECEALRAALVQAEAERQRLREVLDEAQTRISAFVDQFDAVVPHMAGMALMSQIHGVPYAGPQMDIEPLRELLKGDQ